MLTPLYLNPYTEEKEEYENLSFEIDWDVDMQACGQLEGVPMAAPIRIKVRPVISLRNRIRVLLGED